MSLIPPYGGRLVDLVARGEERERLLTASGASRARGGRENAAPL